MKKFVILYFAPAAEVAQWAKASEEDKQASLKKWMDWKAKYEDNILDLGSPIIPGQKRKANTEWASCSNDVSGFSIVQGESAEEVKSMLDNHPHTASSPTFGIGIYPCASM